MIIYFNIVCTSYKHRTCSAKCHITPNGKSGHHTDFVQIGHS